MHSQGKSIMSSAVIIINNMKITTDNNNRTISTDFAGIIAAAAANAASAKIKVVFIFLTFCMALSFLSVKLSSSSLKESNTIHLQIFSTETCVSHLHSVHKHEQFCDRD